MVALTYMNSSRFGASIDVTPGHPEVKQESVQEVQSSNQSMMQKASEPIIASGVFDVYEPSFPVWQASKEFSEGPPPQAIVSYDIPEAMSDDTGFSVGSDGLQSLEFKETSQPILSSFDIPLPEPSKLPELPRIQVPELPEFVGGQPPFNPVVFSQKQTAPPQVPEFPEPAPNPFPFLGSDEARLELGPVYTEDKLSADLNTYQSEVNQLRGLDDLQDATRNYLDAINEILYGMAQEIREAKSRLTEIETVFDRRYSRRP